MLNPIPPVPRLEPAPRNPTPDDAHAPASGTPFADLLRERSAAAAPPNAGGRDAPPAPSSAPAPRRPPAGPQKDAAESAPEPARPSAPEPPAAPAREASAEQESDEAHDPAGDAESQPTAPLNGAQPGAMPTRPAGEGARPQDAAKTSGTKNARSAARPAPTGQPDAGSAGAELGGAAVATSQSAIGAVIAASAESARGESLRTGAEFAGLAAASPAFTRALAQAVPPAVTLATPLAAPNFGAALAAQVTVFARDGMQQAELRLNPPEMGPIGIQIELVGHDARINFHALQAATREAIERALPELAGALREEGLTLTGGGVFDRPAHARGEGPPPGRLGQRAGAEPLPPAPVRLQLSQGTVDLYA